MKSQSEIVHDGPLQKQEAPNATTQSDGILRSNPSFITNITSRLFAHVTQQPQAPALCVLDGPTLSYREVWQQTDTARSFFHQHQLHMGTKILLLVPLNLQLLLLILACFAEGITPVLIDPRLKKRFWLRGIKLSSPQSIITTRRLIPWLRLLQFFYWPMRKARLLAYEDIFTNSLATQELLSPRRVDPDQSVLESLTSGTTGRPKLVTRKFSVLLSQQTLATKYLPEVPQDRHLTAYGIAALQALIDGAFVVLAPDQSAEKMRQLIIRHQIQRISGPPSLFVELLKIENWPDSLRCLMTGSAPVPDWLLSTLRRRLPSGQVWNVYGSTECEPICLTAADRKTEHPGYFVGSIIPELQLQKLHAFSVRNLTCFEIGLNGENLACFPDSFATGDMAHMTEQGDLYLLGRKSEMIRGIPIGLLEEPLEGQFGIKRVAFVEVQDHIHGFLEGAADSEPNLEQETLIRQHLRNFDLTLTSLKVIEKFPVDARHHWKIQRQILRKECL